MKYSGIGGQAVMEGVMMKNKERYAVAVRKEDGEIVVEEKEYKGVCPVEAVRKIPIVRGVVNFIDSLYLGISSLMFSAQFFEDDPEAGQGGGADSGAESLPGGKTDSGEQPLPGGKTDSGEQPLPGGKTDSGQRPEAGRGGKPSSKKENAVIGGTVAVSLVIAILLFMLLPFYLSQFLGRVVESDTLVSIVEGLLRLVIFFGYLAIISRMEDIQRVFMYHGAEHKCINCIEHGLELNVENVRRSSRQHKRCGTNFLFIVMIISVVCFIFIQADTHWMKLLYRLILIPVVAGLSYECIRIAGKYDNALVNVLNKPGMLLQKMTTREPDDSMIEVGIASVEAVFDWRGFLNEDGQSPT